MMSRAFLTLLSFAVLQAQDLDLLSKARESVAREDFSAAERSVRDFLVTHAEAPDAYFLLGYIFFKKQDPKSSLAAYTEGARYRRPSATDVEVVGCDYVLLKDYTDADKWFSQSVAWDPSNISALYYLGRTKYNENRFEEAVSTFLQCLKSNPRNVKYEDNLGLSYQGLGRNEEALAAYRIAIEWDKDCKTHDSGPYLDLGTLLLDTGHPADAMPLLEQAVQHAPHDLRALAQLGKAYLHADQFEKAQTEFEAVVQLDPRNAPAHFMLAQVYRKRGLLEKAKRESETYTTLNQDRPDN